MNQKILASLMLCVVFLGCQTATRLNRINLGMTKAEVLGVLGKYNRITVTPGVEVLDYMYPRSRLTKLPYDGAEHYWIFLEDNRVIKYGPAMSFMSSADRQVATAQNQAAAVQDQVAAQGLQNFVGQLQQQRFQREQLGIQRQQLAAQQQQSQQPISQGTYLNPLVVKIED